jgi:hypothetical protein
MMSGIQRNENVIRLFDRFVLHHFQGQQAVYPWAHDESNFLELGGGKKINEAKLRPQNDACPSMAGEFPDSAGAGETATRIGHSWGGVPPNPLDPGAEDRGTWKACNFVRTLYVRINEFHNICRREIT